MKAHERATVEKKQPKVDWPPVIAAHALALAMVIAACFWPWLRQLSWGAITTGFFYPPILVGVFLNLVEQRRKTRQGVRAHIDDSVGESGATVASNSDVLGTDHPSALQRVISFSAGWLIAFWLILGPGIYILKDIHR